MYAYKQLLAGLLFAFLTGCSTLKVSFDYDPSQSFTGLKTYAWVPNTPGKTNNLRIDTDTLVQDRIRREITSWLDLHGYQPVELEEADFLVAYQLVVQDKTQVRVINDYYDYPMGWYYGYPGYYGGRTRAYTYEYQQGTLIIDLVDSESKKLIWRGTGTDEVTAADTPAEREQQIRDAVDKIMAQFPPPEKSTP